MVHPCLNLQERDVEKCSAAFEFGSRIDENRKKRRVYVGVTVADIRIDFPWKCKEAQRFHRRMRYDSVVKIQPMLRSSNFNELVGRTPRAPTPHSHKGGRND